MSARKEPLRNEVFVFTGDMSIDRDDAKMRVVMLGGRCTTVPSSKTTLLVAGSNPGPSKMQKARELNIRIVNEEEFLELIEESLRGFDDTVEVNRRRGREGGDSMHTKRPVKEQGHMWSEKYRPRSRDELVGNSGVVTQLEEYLQGQTKYKAVLLSGQPGIGKTTAAHLVCRSLGYTVIEFNASDVRNRSEINSKIKSFVNSGSISGNTGLKKKVLIMDEIDGMTSDKGGIPELTNVIKRATIPVICICNDRSNPKIRTLASYCLDLKFRKLEARQILPRIKYILEKEGKQVPDGLMNELLLVSGGDIRYILNTLQNLVLRRTLSSSQAEGFIKKNSMKSVFDIAVEVFQRKSFGEKMDLYFEDYSLIPLFVSENILKLPFKSTKDLHLCCDSVSLGDVVERYIRGSSQEWSLAPLHALYSTIMPIHGKALTKKMDFPSWLGQNSKYSKLKKLLRLISIHSSGKVRMSSDELRKYGLQMIAKEYMYNLETGNIGGAVNNIAEYDLTKEDMNGICEIVLGHADPTGKIGRKIKTALSREYKKLDRKLPYVEEADKESESGNDESEEYRE